MGSVSVVPAELFEEVILPKVVAEIGGFKCIACLRSTCVYFAAMEIRNSVYGSVNFVGAPCLGYRSSGEYRKLLERCVSAGNCDAKYLLGISMYFLLGEEEAGVLMLEDADRGSLIGVTSFKKHVKYAVWLISFGNERVGVADQLFTEVMELFWFDSKSGFEVLVDLLKVHHIKNHMFIPVLCMCSCAVSCNRECDDDGDRDGWMVNFCCSNCLAVKEYGCFGRLVHESWVKYLREHPREFIGKAGEKFYWKCLP